MDNASCRLSPASWAHWWAVPPLAGHFHLPALMSLAGAALLVVAVHVLRRGSLR